MQIPARKIKFRDPTTGEIRETLLLSEGRVDEAVEEYLDAHPEKTTTVEDGSIEKNKLAGTLIGILQTEKDTVEVSSQELTGKAYRNIKIVYSPTLTIGDDCHFHDCDFVCDTFSSGTTTAILITGKNALFEGCTFTGVNGSTTQIKQEKTAFNTKFVNCSFDGTFKNPLNLGSTNNNLVSGCYFAPLTGNDSNIYQLKLSYAGPIDDESYAGTGKTIVTGCYFDGLIDDPHTAIDCYCGGHDLIITSCVFRQNSGVTIKTDWRDLTSEEEAGSNINYVRYSRNINVRDCLFVESKRICYIANTQYSETNIGVTVPNNIVFSGCMIVDAEEYAFVSGDNIPTSELSTVIISDCHFYESAFGRIASKDLIIDGCSIVVTKDVSSVGTGFIRIGNTKNNCNSVTIKNCYVRNYNASNDMSAIYQVGAIKKVVISNSDFDMGNTKGLITAINSAKPFNEIIVDNIKSSGAVYSSSPTAQADITVIRNSYFKRYALTRPSSSTGYGSNLVYILNCISVEVSSITQSATGWTESDHVFNSFALNGAIDWDFSQS